MDTIIAADAVIIPPAVSFGIAKLWTLVTAPTYIPAPKPDYDRIAELEWLCDIPFSDPERAPVCGKVWRPYGGGLYRCVRAPGHLDRPRNFPQWDCGAGSRHRSKEGSLWGDEHCS